MQDNASPETIFAADFTPKHGGHKTTRTSGLERWRYFHGRVTRRFVFSRSLLWRNILFENYFDGTTCAVLRVARYITSCRERICATACTVPCFSMLHVSSPFSSSTGVVRTCARNFSRRFFFWSFFASEVRKGSKKKKVCLSPVIQSQVKKLWSRYTQVNVERAHSQTRNRVWVSFPVPW